MPIDGSAHSTRALQEAIKIAKTTSGTLTLLTVQPSHPKISSPPKQPINDTPKSIILAEGQKLVQEQGVFAETVLLEGNVVDQIVNTAKEGTFGMGPEDLGSYFKQQNRWAMGNVGVLRTVLLNFLKSPFSLKPIQWFEYMITGS